MGTSLTATGVQFPDNSVQIAPALTGFRNRIINGDMKISQRGTSFAAVADGAYTIDRFKYEKNNTSVVTITQNSDVPPGSRFPSSIRATVTTADTSITSTEYSFIAQTIEGYNVADLVGVPITLSFWVKSSKTGIHCVFLRSALASRSYISEYSINSANTWEQKTITVQSGLDISGGSWDFTNGVGIQVGWCMAVGSNYQSTSNNWITANVKSTSNQVNCLDTVGNIFAITGIQLEKSSTATDFEFRHYSAELSLCQRYYQTYTVVVETNVNFSTFAYAVPMRAAPTIAGGGAGFTINVGTSQAYNAYQTARSGQTLTFSSEL